MVNRTGKSIKFEVRQVVRINAWLRSDSNIDGLNFSDLIRESVEEYLIKYGN